MAQREYVRFANDMAEAVDASFNELNRYINNLDESFSDEELMAIPTSDLYNAEEINFPEGTEQAITATLNDPTNTLVIIDTPAEGYVPTPIVSLPRIVLPIEECYIIEPNRVQGVDQESLNEYLCSICGGIPRDAKWIDGCDHPFCHFCIAKYALFKGNSKYECATCRHTSETLKTARVIKNIVASHKYKCATEGCEDILAYDDIGIHEAECSKNKDRNWYCLKCEEKFRCDTEPKALHFCNKWQKEQMKKLENKVDEALDNAKKFNLGLWKAVTGLTCVYEKINLVKDRTKNIEESLCNLLDVRSNGKHL